MGKIFLEDMIGGNFQFDPNCPLCDNVSGSREVLLEAYNTLNADPSSPCSKPSEASNFDDAHNKELFLLLFLREQMLATCDVDNNTTKPLATMSLWEYKSSVGGRCQDKSKTTKQDCEDANRDWFSERPGYVFNEVSDLTQCKLTMTACAPGMYCEENKWPVACPEGFYCDTYSGGKTICPSDHYCPLGAKTPTKCESMLSSCPEGSSNENAPYLLLLIVFLLFVKAIIIFYLRKRREEAVKGK
eukprot:g5588.t1